MKINRPVAVVLASLCVIATGSNMPAAVGLQNATATFSQTSFGDYSVARAINGTTADNLGWALDPQITAQTAVFETTADIGFGGGSLLTFVLSQFHLDPAGHTLGRFRLSVTTDNRSTFADGLATGGDVTANWIVLQPISYASAGGATLGVLGDSSVLASGFAPETDTYTITAMTLLTGITGVRLEALEDPSLPFAGPGRQPQNGNFVLSEFSVDIASIPEPSPGALLLAGFAIFMVARKVSGSSGVLPSPRAQS